MTEDYRAAPELWAAAEKWGANTMDMANCILELRARVEALEARHQPGFAEITTSLHSYKIGEAEPIEEWGKGHTLVNTEPTLKEQALQDLDALAKDLERNGMGFGTATIRRALEALDD
jgi:ribonuclease HI